jgi:hypothetical protein
MKTILSCFRPEGGVGLGGGEVGGVGGRGEGEGKPPMAHALLLALADLLFCPEFTVAAGANRVSIGCRSKQGKHWLQSKQGKHLLQGQTG